MEYLTDKQIISWNGRNLKHRFTVWYLDVILSSRTAQLLFVLVELEFPSAMLTPLRCSQPTLMDWAFRLLSGREQVDYGSFFQNFICFYYRGWKLHHLPLFFICLFLAVCVAQKESEIGLMDLFWGLFTFLLTWPHHEKQIKYGGSVLPLERRKSIL